MSVKSFLMTWMADGQFRPPASYHGQLMGLGGFRGLVRGTNRTRLRLSWKRLMQIAIPTVYASASATVDGPVTESSNTTDDLTESRLPNIVVTENDVLAVLEKETGVDRLRVMFRRE